MLDVRRNGLVLLAVASFSGLSLAGCGGGAPAATVSSGGSGATTTATTTPAGGSGSASAGQALFQQKCQVCHGPNGTGGTAPGLNKGLLEPEDFRKQADLEAFIKQNMPQNNPGSLSNAQAEDASAYVWSIMFPKS